MKKHADLVHLHVHTQYSLLDGAIKIKDLMKRSDEYGLPAVAMTDHGNMFGTVDFYTEAEKAGLKPIIGCEVYVAQGSRHVKEHTGNGKPPMNHLILLAMDNTGYLNLSKLVTASWLEGFYYKPRIDKEILAEHNEGLIALSACLKGEIPSALLKGGIKMGMPVLDEMREIFDDRFYLEIQENGIPEQTRVNEMLIEMSKDTGVKLVATTDSHYLDQEHASSHEVLLCIQTGKTMEDKNRFKFQTDQLHFRSPEEMYKVFDYAPEAVRNTVEVAERCNVKFDLGKFHFPKFEVEEGETLESRFEDLVRKGFDVRIEEFEEANGKISKKKLKEYEDRMDLELKVIKKMGFSGYFLIVEDFIRYARTHGIAVGPGRGSAAGSLVAYCLKITDIDPIKYDLLFERFLNPDRLTMPDIDVDFSNEDRDDVIKYVTEKYGGLSHVAQIITFGTMQARGVIRDVGRALNMPYIEVDRIAKLIPNQLKITLTKALDMEPRLNQLKKENPKVEELLKHAMALEGLARHSSKHASAVVISDKPLVEYMPLCKSGKDEITTQFEMNSVEKMGLVKFDFLGLKTISMTRECLRLIKETTGKVIDIEKIPLDEPKVWDILAKGMTAGLFQLESSGMTDLVVKLKPHRFEDMIALVALYRPGPLESGMVDDFIARKHGRKEMDYPIEQLSHILEDTYGVILYQEQVMLIANEIGNMSMSEADIVRKAMSKKDKDEIYKWKEPFLKGAEKQKVPRAKAEKLFEVMAGFGEYGFNKSHSAAYALVSYRTAYLKALYPTQFMAALLSNERGNSDAIARYLGRCKEMNIEVLPPDVNESALNFSIKDGKISFGLLAIKGVGESAIESVVEARRSGGPFKSLFEFCERVDLKRVNKKVVENLIRCGAFDYTNLPRWKLEAAIPNAMDAAQRAQDEREAGQVSMLQTLGVSNKDMNKEIEAMDVEEWPENVLLQHEKDALGFYLTGHPLARFEKEIKKYGSYDISELAEARDGAEVRLAGIVMTIKEKFDRRGRMMAFVQFEDLYGTCELIVRSDVYKASAHVLKGDDAEPLIVVGKLDNASEKPKIVVETVFTLSEAANRLTRRLHLKLQSTGFGQDELETLKSIIDSCPGECPVYLHVVIPFETETVIEMPKSMNVNPSEDFKSRVSQAFGPEISIRDAL